MATNHRALQTAIGKISHHAGDVYKARLSPSEAVTLVQAGALLLLTEAARARRWMTEGRVTSLLYYFELPERLIKRVLPTGMK